MIGFIHTSPTFSIPALEALQEYADVKYTSAEIETSWGFEEFIVPPNSTNVSTGGNIQSAIDNMYALGGGTVNLEAGTFYGQWIKIKSNVDLVGAGIGQTIILSTGNNAPIFHATSADSTSVQNMKIREMTIDGSAITGTHAGPTYSANIVEFAGGGFDNILLENLEIFHDGVNPYTKSRILFYGYNWTTNTTRITIKNCETYGAYDNTHGIAIRYAEGVVIANCDCRDNGGLGIDFSRVKYGEMVNCTMPRNYLQGCKFLGGNYTYIHDSSITEMELNAGTSGINFNQLCESENDGLQYFHMKNILVDSTPNGVVEWNQNCTPPTFEEFVSEGNILTNNIDTTTFEDRNTIRLDGCNDGHTFGVSQENIIEANSGSSVTVTHHATGIPSDFGVGWTTWGNPI